MLEAGLEHAELAFLALLGSLAVLAVLLLTFGLNEAVAWLWQRWRARA